MQSESPKLKAWLTAEADAQAAERELHEAMLRSRDNDPPGLLEPIVARARAKRDLAGALFDDAMQELKDLAESRHHPRVPVAHTPRLDGADAPPHGRPGSGGGSQPQRRADRD